MGVIRPHERALSAEWMSSLPYLCIPLERWLYDGDSKSIKGVVFLSKDIPWLHFVAREVFLVSNQSCKRFSVLESKAGMARGRKMKDICA